MNLFYLVSFLGQQPYADVPYDTLCTHLESGHRLPEPGFSPRTLSILMKSCWKWPNSEARPTFQAISQQLKTYMKGGYRGARARTESIRGASRGATDPPGAYLPMGSVRRAGSTTISEFGGSTAGYWHGYKIMKN